MIAKLTRGSGFRGLMDYLFREGKGAEILGGNMVGLSPRALALEFAGTRRANRKVKTPVFHCSLSLPPGASLSSERWVEVSQSLLQKLGLNEKRPWIVVRHHDRDHEHVHLVTSRTDYTGSVWYGEWEVNRVLKAKEEIEQEYGLTATPVVTPVIRLKDCQAQRIRRELDSGHDSNLPPQIDLAVLVDKAVAASDGNLEAFEDALNASGIEVKLNRSVRTGGIAGASFRLVDGEWLKGSQIGKEFRWKRIAERLAAIQAVKSEATNNIIKNEHVRLNAGIQSSSAADLRNEKYAGHIAGSQTQDGIRLDRRPGVPATRESGDRTQETSEFVADSRKKFRKTDGGTDFDPPGFRGTIEADGSGGCGQLQYLRLFLEVMVGLVQRVIKQASEIRHIPKPSNWDQRPSLGLTRVKFSKGHDIRRKFSI